jgi:hypothetical protein
MKLVEIFNNSFKYSWATKDSDSWVATFETSVNDIEVEFVLVEAGKHGAESYWDVAFHILGKRGNYELTSNNRDQLRIFGTVIDIIKEFVRTNPKVKTIGFSIDKTEGRDGGRERLYMKLVQKVSSELGIKGVKAFDDPEEYETPYVNVRIPVR